MVTFKVIKAGWVHPENAIINEDEIPPGRTVQECIQKGLITPHDGQYDVPLDDKDAKGWKSRAAALEGENQKLRTATTDAAILAENLDLKNQAEALLAERERLETELDKFNKGTVTMDQFRDVNAELQSLQVAHEELKKSYGELSAKTASG